MRKLLLVLVLLISFNGAFAANQGSYDEGSDVSTNLNNFAPDTLVGTKIDKYTVETGFKTQISTIVKNISIVLSIIAVGALVFSGLKMTLSQGKDEDIKKAKDIIKWTIIGYLRMISAGAIIAIVINFIYGLG